MYEIKSFRNEEIGFERGQKHKMCSRYQIDGNIINDLPNIKGSDKWYNRAKRDIHPTDSAPVIVGKKKELQIQEQKWGFNSYYDGKLLINARAETVLEKKTFSDCTLNRRIIIPARLFYEWNSKKQKVSFYKEGEETVYMAGIYRDEPDGRKFTIITTVANDSMKPVHDRMPLIIEKNAVEDWIFDDQSIADILAKIPSELKPRCNYWQMSIFDI